MRSNLMGGDGENLMKQKAWFALSLWICEIIVFTPISTLKSDFATPEPGFKDEDDEGMEKMAAVRDKRKDWQRKWWEEEERPEQEY